MCLEAWPSSGSALNAAQWKEAGRKTDSLCWTKDGWFLSSENASLHLGDLYLICIYFLQSPKIFKTSHFICRLRLICTSMSRSMPDAQLPRNVITLEVGMSSEWQVDNVPFISGKSEMDVSIVSIRVVSSYLYMYESTWHYSLHVKAQKQHMHRWMLINGVIHRFHPMLAMDAILNSKLNSTRFLQLSHLKVWFKGMLLIT